MNVISRERKGGLLTFASGSRVKYEGEGGKLGVSR